MHVDNTNTNRIPQNDRRYGFVIRMGATHNDITRFDYWHGKTEKAPLGSKFGKHLAGHAAQIMEPDHAKPARKKAA